MSRVNVYLPDDLAARARLAGLNVSALTQDAVRRALGAHETNLWLATLPADSEATVPHESTLDALDATRADPITRHG